MLLGGLVLQNKAPAIICQSLSSRARDVAKRPGDVCYATTEAAAETAQGPVDLGFARTGAAAETIEADQNKRRQNDSPIILPTMSYSKTVNHVFWL